MYAIIPEFITIGQFNKVMNIQEDEGLNDLTKTLKIIGVVTGVKDSLLMRIPAKQLEELGQKVNTLITPSDEFQKTYTHNGVKFGFIPSLENITTGEFIDIDTYSNEDILYNLHKIMAVLYRPVTEEKGELYRIEKYTGNGDDQAFLDWPLSVANGALSFFLNLGQGLLINSPEYLEGAEMKPPFLSTVGIT